MLRLAVLGHPVAHSLSPAMHAHALRTLGLPGTYEALETPLVHLADRLEEVRREYRGVNFTIPLKEKALELVDWAAPEAKAIGAVNTVLSLKGVGLEVWVWNRTEERALALAEAFGLRAVPLERAREARLLVNATSVGLNAPEETPLPAELFPEAGAAVDLVYRPLWTRFLKEARARGLLVQTGLPMLAWQGALAFQIWTGLLPDPKGMEEAALRALGG